MITIGFYTRIRLAFGPRKITIPYYLLLVSLTRLYDTPLLHVSGGVRNVSCWWCLLTCFVTSAALRPLIILSSSLYNTHFLEALS